MAITTPEPKIPTVDDNLDSTCSTGLLRFVCDAAGPSKKALDPFNGELDPAEPQEPPDAGVGTTEGVTITRDGKIFLSTGMASGGTGTSFSYRVGKMRYPSKPSDADVDNFVGGLGTSFAYGKGGVTYGISTSPTNVGWVADEIGWSTGDGYGSSVSYAYSIN
jgi:hypothetical protein